MKGEAKKPKMTIDKIARMTQEEFSVLRKDVVTKGYLDEKLKGFATKDDLKVFATKDDLRAFATKDDLKDLKEDIRGDVAKVLQGVDRIVTKFDVAEKDHAAQAALFQRMGDGLHDHNQRLKKLEARA